MSAAEPENQFAAAYAPNQPEVQIQPAKAPPPLPSREARTIQPYVIIGPGENTADFRPQQYTVTSEDYEPAPKDHPSRPENLTGITAPTPLSSSPDQTTNGSAKPSAGPTMPIPPKRTAEDGFSSLHPESNSSET